MAELVPEYEFFTIHETTAEKLCKSLPGWACGGWRVCGFAIDPHGTGYSYIALLERVLNHD